MHNNPLLLEDNLVIMLNQSFGFYVESVLNTDSVMLENYSSTFNPHYFKNNSHFISINNNHSPLSIKRNS